MSPHFEADPVCIRVTDPEVIEDARDPLFQEITLTYFNQEMSNFGSKWRIKQLRWDFHTRALKITPTFRTLELRDI